MGTALPGFDAPTVGFEQPYEMLQACHERVQRSLDLLQRLTAHVQTRGHDAQSRSAAADVLRYFDLAAPHHHEDEERHVFPPLLAGGDAALRAAVLRLQEDHRQMTGHWAALRPLLQRWSAPGCREAPDAAALAAIERFRALYADHIGTEEGLVYPAARTGMDAPALAAMGTEMQARRRG